MKVWSLLRPGWRLRGFKLNYVFKNTTGDPCHPPHCSAAASTRMDALDAADWVAGRTLS